MDLSQNQYYQQALEYIGSTDLKSLEPGKHFINGDALFVNIVDATMKDTLAARYEVHNAYIDIQVPLEVAESFGVKPRSECTQPDGEYNQDRDILFYNDPILPEQIVTAQPGEALTFGPETAHAPQIGQAGSVARKAIFKVKVV